MPSGLLIAGVCFLLLSGVSSVWQFYAAYIVARAVSNPVLIGLVPRTAAVNFFRRRRNIALALVSTFRPIAGAINIQLIALIAISQSWRDAFRYLGIFAFALVIPVVLLMRRRPEDIGLQPDGAAGTPPPQPSPGGRGGSAAAPPPETSWTVREAIRTRPLLADCRHGLRGNPGVQQRGFQPGSVPGGGGWVECHRRRRRVELWYGAVPSPTSVGASCPTSSRRAAA